MCCFLEESNLRNKKLFITKHLYKYKTTTSLQTYWRHIMVDVVRVSKKGKLLEIKEVSDKYRDIPYTWKKE